MGNKIAIITGASGGIGREFVKKLLEEDVDEIWAVARNREKLVALQKEMGRKIVVIPKDLTKSEELYSIGEMLYKEKPVVAYLVNNAGIARMGSYKEFTVEEIENTININCSAMAVLCTMCIPYMQKDSRILNISSASAFQPQPYLNLYGATKVFERNYSRALNAELKGSGITVTAVCPGWVDTELLMRKVNGKTVKFPGMVSAARVVETALKDAKRGKDMSVCSLYVKYEHVIAKLFPQRAVMRVWLKGIRKYGFQ